MFSTKIRGGKAFAAEQKIRELKNYFIKQTRKNTAFHLKRLRKNHLKVKNFEKFMIFIEC